MKHFISLIIIVSIALGGTAQSKINPTGRIAIDRFRQQSTRMATNSTAGISDPTVSIIVRLAKGVDTEWLTQQGYNVAADMTDMAVVTLPITAVESLAANPQVQSISFGRKQRLLMAKARAAAEVDEAHSGITTDNGYQPFTGDGVILGMMDGGLQANHINFAGRIERLWHFITDEYTFKTTVNEYTASNLSGFTTDDSEASHATHVAGIMAGGYRSTGTYMNGATKTTGDIPFYGVAPDAALAFSIGDLYEANIIKGVENIIEYAESQGKPAAINLSLGNNSGPHDGTDDFSQALDRLGQRALICVAAGNEGEKNISIEKTLTSSDKTVKTILFYNNRIIDSNYGALDIWASDGETLSVTIANVSSSGSISNATTISSATGDNARAVTGCVKNDGGEVTVYSGIDPNNGRYNVYIDFYYALPKSGRFSISVTGKEGQTVNMWFDGYSEFSNRYTAYANPLSGYSAGTPDCSISGMACGENVLAVGAYSTLDSWTALGGTHGSSDQSVIGSHASFSSYGRDFSGRQLPHVSAPGTMLMSSFSRYYVTDSQTAVDYDETADFMVATAKNGSHTDYWGPMEGTSMACPFMTGTLGLWLQAEPTLTMETVMDVLENTCTKDSYTAAAPERFGHGKVNAAEGLRYLMSTAGIGTVPDSRNSTLIEPTDGGYIVTVAGDASFRISIYDLQGRCVAEKQSSEPSIFVPTGHLSDGIYVMNIRGAMVNVSHKITK